MESTSDVEKNVNTFIYVCENDVDGSIKNKQVNFEQQFSDQSNPEFYGSGDQKILIEWIAG